MGTERHQGQRHPPQAESPCRMEADSALGSGSGVSAGRQWHSDSTWNAVGIQPAVTSVLRPLLLSGAATLRQFACLDW